jgi:glycerol-3-phosphate acyltransferase PlsX
LRSDNFPEAGGAAVARVAIDAMGGDLAPRAVVAGALAALADDPSLEVALVGDEGAIREAAGGALPARATLVPAAEWIEMGEHAVEALKKKKDTSIARALGLVREGRAQAFFSAGNTGACVAAASLALRRVEGVRRPGIAVAFPTPRGLTVLMDAGANLAPKPVDLVQYAAMATVYAREVLGVAEPTVGALNIGAEEEKGGELVREAARLLKLAPALRFHGFVEGHDIFRGTTDVVVCEAFVGNAILKVAEGIAETMFPRVRAALERHFPAPEERARLGLALGELTRAADYAEYGAAPLLGVDGVVLIGHGRSEVKAIRSGIRQAARSAQRDLTRKIAVALAALPATS